MASDIPVVGNSASQKINFESPRTPSKHNNFDFDSNDEPLVLIVTPNSGSDSLAPITLGAGWEIRIK
jgi:hypothetical protein